MAHDLPRLVADRTANLSAAHSDDQPSMHAMATAGRASSATYTHAHIWDASAVAAIDRVILKLQDGGSTVHSSGLNEASSALLERPAVHGQPGASLLAGHG